MKYDEPTERYQISIPPKIAVALRCLGQGSVSAGIVRAYRMLRARVGESRE